MSSMWIGRTDAPVVGEERRTVSTRKRQRGQCWRGPLRPSPRLGTDAMEIVRTLRVARQSALKARTQAANELHTLVVTTALESVRAQLRRLKIPGRHQRGSISSKCGTHHTDCCDQVPPGRGRKSRAGGHDGSPGRCQHGHLE
jgi:hypothetical protein